MKFHFFRYSLTKKRDRISICMEPQHNQGMVNSTGVHFLILTVVLASFSMECLSSTAAQNLTLSIGGYTTTPFYLKATQNRIWSSSSLSGALLVSEAVETWALNCVFCWFCQCYKPMKVFWRWLQEKLVNHYPEVNFLQAFWVLSLQYFPSGFILLVNP